jgi:hypothetical protein
VLLVAGGDNDFPCFTTGPEDELFAASFTGQGPAQGLTLTRIAYLDTTILGHHQGFEAATNIGLQNGGPPVPEIGGVLYPGRMGTNLVPLPRNVESSRGEVTLGTWVFMGAGVSTYCTPAGTQLYWDGTIASGAIFDPFYRLLPATAFNAQPRPNARDLEVTQQDLNPTGVVGTWLALDGRYPATDRINFGDTTFPGNWPRIGAHRAYSRSLSVAGEDGIYDTTDDRVLISGGGQDPRDQGGEASEPAAEILIAPQSPP